MSSFGSGFCLQTQMSALAKQKFSSIFFCSQMAFDFQCILNLGNEEKEFNKLFKKPFASFNHLFRCE